MNYCRFGFLCSTQNTPANAGNKCPFQHMPTCRSLASTVSRSCWNFFSSQDPKVLLASYSGHLAVTSVFVGPWKSGGFFSPTPALAFRRPLSEESLWLLCELCWRLTKLWPVLSTIMGLVEQSSPMQSKKAGSGSFHSRFSPAWIGVPST